MQKKVFVLAAKRTPVGSFLGGLSSVVAPRLGAIALKGALADSQLKADQIEQVYMGCVLSAGLGQAPARQAALFAGLNQSVPCTTVSKVCGSGMKAVMLAVQSIQTGECDVVAAGGMENMSQVPHYLPGSRAGFKMGHFQAIDGMVHDGLWDVYNNFHMGNAAELCASKFKFSRDAQDAYAVESFKRAQAAINEGRFTSEIAPVEIPQKKGDPVTIEKDEGPFKAQFEKMSKLPAVFQKDGTITAANASSINDGAAALILASEDFVKKTGLKPLAQVVNYASHAQQPEWFTTAPVEASKKLLKKSQWEKNSVDLWEVNEAFAIVAMAAMKELELDHAKVNVNGSGISLGHPIGASGARIVVTLLHALQNRNLKRGVATLCIGGGEATAMSFERV